ncbi:unnamed protein product [Fraxinus pennsylvanica]|uniref:Wall-associated receptor kinase galacturonan-binding domain-containing protein n=1 Tax=Fraxinus pennsylvanica TaxID=56036 RepID=A0AAD1ZDB2_9LAMI|nr:unnamed protein product [Fraxinus pennsylvanica]
MFLHIFCLLSLAVAPQSIAQGTKNSSAKPGCESRCGNIEVSYPFGIGNGSNCSLNSWFYIQCASVNPPKAYLGTTGIEDTAAAAGKDTRVTHISVQDALISMNASLFHERRQKLFQDARVPKQSGYRGGFGLWNGITTTIINLLLVTQVSEEEKDQKAQRKIL